MMNILISRDELHALLNFSDLKFGLVDLQL